MSKILRHQMGVGKCKTLCQKTLMKIYSEKVEVSERLLVENYVEGCGMPLADVRSQTQTQYIANHARDFGMLGKRPMNQNKRIQRQSFLNCQRESNQRQIEHKFEISCTRRSGSTVVGRPKVLSFRKLDHGATIVTIPLPRRALVSHDESK
jgi:hypothetical protein